MNFHDINPLLYSRSTKRLKIEFHDDNNFTKRDSTHEKTVTLYESPKETSFFRIQTSNTGRSKKMFIILIYKFKVAATYSVF